MSSRRGAGEVTRVIDDQLDDTLVVPRSVRLPVELIPPEGFDPGRLETWPEVVGRVEWVGGRLLWMPPCGEAQAQTVVDVVGALMPWMRAHPEFAVGTNEAGMLLGDDVRAVDVGVWRRRPGPPRPGLSLEPPVLAVDVAGRDDTYAALRDKADWYLAAGVSVVWVALPAERQVFVVRPAGETRHGIGDRLPLHAELPALALEVEDLFRQVALD